MLRFQPAAVLVCAASLFAAAPASAQVSYMPAVIAATVGNVVSQQRCYPVADALKARWLPVFDANVQAYADASAAGDGKALRKLWSRQRGGGEMAADGTLRDSDTLFRLSGGGSGPAPKVERVKAVVEGGNGGARGIWKATKDGAPDSFYAVDFQRSFGGAWQIWRVRRYDSAEAAPVLPDSFCDRSEMAALW